MIGYGQIQVTSKLTTTASSTAELFSEGGSGTKWCLTKGLISVFVPAAGAYVELHETTAAEVDLGTILCVPAATNGVAVVPIDFGEEGWRATATNTRLVWLVGGANASITVICVGYYR